MTDDDRSGGTPAPSNGGTPAPQDHGKATPRGGAVVLDLQELDRLGRVYQDASDEVVRHRRVVGDIAAAFEAARVALPDKGLAGAISSTVSWLLETGAGLDHDAFLMHDLSAYCGDVARLAREADADRNGTWTKAETAAFAAKHRTDPDDPALRAVREAFTGGTIVRTDEDAARAAARDGGSGSAVGDVLALAGTQHATESRGDNVTKYNQWYGDPGQPWCATFVSWVFAHAGHPLPPVSSPKGFAYVPDGIAYAKQHGQLDATPHAGDVFLLKDGSHAGIVSKVHGDGTFDTVEGNHGDAVAHVRRNSHDGSYYFWTVPS